jgi:prevent-host-death family protein
MYAMQRLDTAIGYGNWMGGNYMLEVNVKELREQLAQFIARVEAGEEITITRRGKVVARLVPPQPTPTEFPDLSAFRAKIELRGEPMSETVIRERREAPY